mgnify:CR=1 FL=1
MNKGEVQLTVLIPFYNTAIELWKDAVRSMENQICKDFNVLVVDDGSTLVNPETVLSESQLNWSLIRLDRNFGIETALNKGINSLTTDWFSRFDSDDVMLPNRIQIELDAIRKNPHAAVIASGARTNDGNILPASSDFEFEIQFGCPFIHAATAFNKKKIFYPLYEARVEAAEDWLMWKKIIDSGLEIVTIPVPVIHYRVHSNNSSIGPNDIDKQSRYCRVAHDILGVHPDDTDRFLKATGKFEISSTRSFLQTIAYVGKVTAQISANSIDKRMFAAAKRRRVASLICKFGNHRPWQALVLSLVYRSPSSFRYVLATTLKSKR